MIDHIIKFANEVAAQVDPVVGGYWYADGNGGGAWDGSRCIAGVKVWQPANDTTTTQNGPQGSIAVTQHTYLPYFYVLVSTKTMTQELSNHPGCMLVIDRDKANAGEPAFVIYSAIPAGQLASYMFAPTFAGANYPFGSSALAKAVALGKGQ